MRNRIDEKFSELKQISKKALITYVTAGDPELSVTPELVKVMIDAGADIVEIGIPYSDPIAEGPIIQAASARALKHKIRIDDIFNCVKEIRKEINNPLVLLVYFNCIFKYGIDRFLQACLETGVDGLIIPDLPYEEKQEIQQNLHDSDVYVITMVAPTSGDRIKKIVKDAKGFVYCVSSLGVTGERKEFHENLRTFVNEIRKYTDIPRAIGFGISTVGQVKELKEYCEGLIIGSAIVRRIGEASCSEEILKNVKGFVAELRQAMDE